MKHFIVVALICLALGTAAQAQNRSDQFRALLAHVPVSFLGPVTRRWDVSFSDLQAAAVAISAPPEGADAFFSTPLGPHYRAPVSSLFRTLSEDSPAVWPELVGFDPSQIRAGLSVMGPPDEAIVLALLPGVAPGVGSVLLANGYAQTDQMGYPALFRGDQDLAFELQYLNQADPFGDGMGMSSRIAIIENTLLQSRSWPLLTSMMQPSEAKLADHPEMIALLAALDAAPADLGALVQVNLLTDPMGMAGWASPLKRGRNFAADVVTGDTPKPDLPFWSMGLIADLTTAQTETALVALVYATRSDADTAAATLQSGWQTLLTFSTGRSFQEITGTGAVTFVTGTGPFVVVLTATQSTYEDNGMLGNHSFLALLQSYYQRDLLLLAPAMP